MTKPALVENQHPESVSLAKPQKFVVILCVSKTQLKPFSFLEGQVDEVRKQVSADFEDSNSYISKSQAFKIKYDFPFFARTHSKKETDAVQQIHTTTHLKLVTEIKERTVFHFPNDCLILVYEYAIADFQSKGNEAPLTLYSEIEAELFKVTEDHFNKLKAADPVLSPHSVLNWRYSYSVYHGVSDNSEFPFTENDHDVSAFLQQDPTIKREFVKNNIFNWEYAYVSLPEASESKERDILSLVAYQCFLYFQLESLQAATGQLIHALKDSYFQNKKSQIDQLIDQSIILKLEVNKLSDSFIPDRVTYARDYQAILKQLELSFESHRKMNLLRSSSQEMVGLVKYVTEIIEVRTSGVIQKVLVALAFYALPGAITDSATFMGILPEKHATEIRGMLFVSLLVFLVAIPYLSIQFKSKFLKK